MKLESYLEESVIHSLTVPKRKHFLLWYIKEISSRWFLLPIEVLKNQKNVWKKIGMFFFLIFLGMALSMPVSVIDEVYIFENTFFHGVFNILLRAIIGWGVFVVMFTFMSVINKIFHPESRLRKKIFEICRARGNIYGADDYVNAADVLRKLKPLRYRDAVQKYGEKIVHLLFLSNTVALMSGKVTRIVSIASIEENRDAGWDD